MANENPAKFEELLKSGGDIQAKLNELAAAFEGDKEDAKAYFDATVGKLAEELGLLFHRRCSRRRVRVHQQQGQRVRLPGRQHRRYLVRSSSSKLRGGPGCAIPGPPFRVRADALGGAWVAAAPANREARILSLFAIGVLPVVIGRGA